MEINSKIAVIGAGTMGNGIAHVFAQHGYPVTLIDVSETALSKALQTIGNNLDRLVKKEIIRPELKQETLDRITTQTSIEKGVSGVKLVIEAATENTELKKKIFAQMDTAADPGTILVTNTSSISIDLLAQSTQRPDRVIGMHFMNPVPVMKLVEIIQGPQTDGSVTDTIVSLSKQLGKVPCVVNDFPGFISNRILMPMINEAVLSLEEGVAGVESIDTIMKLGMAHPMGPLQLADLIGLDVCLSILRVLEDGFQNSKYTPANTLADLVAQGKLGVKSGEGFYVYTPGSKDLKANPRFNA
ncbi:MAG: 3-hydroxybutyryl-CoA dehydrogenase [Bacteroidetes bacterium]|nr:3-hydroxybutyryl-CoA dehydrogenase [Bacteroidota bacterium]